MTIAVLIFWLIALVTATSAVLVVVARNILHAAFSLCLTFLGVAGLYVFLHADYVAAVQLIVYVGGILVLIMFAVMFSTHVQGNAADATRKPLAILAGGVAAVAVFCVVLLMIERLHLPLADANRHGREPYVSTIVLPAEDHAAARATAPARAKGVATEAERGELVAPNTIGHQLLGEYLLPFELVSILLLAALIGAVVIVRKEVR